MKESHNGVIISGSVCCSSSGW